MAVTTSAWEAEQKRQVVEALTSLGVLPNVGECFWTGKTDNSGVGLHVLRDSSLPEPDYYEDFFDA